MNAGRLAMGPRVPGAVFWAMLFNLLCVLGVGSLLAVFFAANPGPLSVVDLFAVLLTPVAMVFLVVTCFMQRGRAWVWVAQLVLLCLVVGIVPVPGLLFVPLLVAWCSAPVRDFFDPPLHREFG